MVVVYDIETIKNFFLYLDVDYTTREEHIFKIGLSHNDLASLVAHLKTKPNQVGFNNLAFDSQVTQFILQNASYWLHHNYNGIEINEEIYKYSQKTIEKSNAGGWADYPSWKLSCKQLDLFKIWHFDNMAKLTSLKWVQYSIDWPDLQDMPMKHYDDITEDQIEDVIRYCRNDVMSTLAFFDITMGRTKLEFYKGKDKIQLRKDIKAKTGIDCLNMNDVKMGDEMNKDSYMKLTGADKQDLKERRSPRDPFKFGDCIPSYVAFKTPELIAFHNKVKDIMVAGEMQTQTVKYCGTTYTIAKGGIHSKDKPRIIKPASYQLLIDADIASQYPRAIIKRRLYPRHLGPEWLVVYEGNSDERLNAKHQFKLTKDNSFKSIDELFKLALNGGGYLLKAKFVH